MTTNSFDHIPLRRPNYFSGQYLLETDFEEQHNYLDARQKYHYRSIYISGIIEGLVVDKKDEKQVTVSKGTAIDINGNLIVLPQDQLVDLSDKKASTGNLYIQWTESADTTTLQDAKSENSYTRWQGKAEIEFDSSTPTGAVTLATVTLSETKVDKLDFSKRQVSGVKLPSPDGNLSLRYQGDHTRDGKALETAFLSGHLSVSGNLSIEGNSSLTGSLTVNNTVSLKGAADKIGLTIDNQGNTTLGGTLTVTDNSTLNGTLKLKEGTAIKQFSSTLPLTNSNDSVPTESVVKTYVDAINTTLTSQKAASAGSPTQDFTAKNLTVSEALSVSQIKIPGGRTGVQNIELLPQGTGTGAEYQAGQMIVGSSTANQGANLAVHGNVGIGTTTPKLHLAIGDDDTGLKQQAENVLAIYTNNVERLRVTANGNVGIGEANPTERLDVNGSIKASFFRGDGANLTNLTGSHIQDRTIPTNKLADSSVLEGKIANDAVTTAKLASSAVTTAKLAVNAVTTDKIANDAVTDAKLASSAVTTAKLASSAVTTDKIANDAVTTNKLAPAARSPWTIGNGNTVTYSTGNVGIGTTTPSTKLQVEGGALSVTNKDSSNNTWGLQIEAGSQPAASSKIGVSQIKATATGTGTGIQNIELLPKGTGIGLQYQAGQVIVGKNEVDGRANLTVNGRASIAALHSPILRSILLTPLDRTTSNRQWEHSSSSQDWQNVITGQLDLETDAYATFIANGHARVDASADACDIAIFIDNVFAIDVGPGDLPYGTGISHSKTWVPIQTLASNHLRGGKKYEVALKMRARHSKGQVYLSGPLMIILLTGGT